jgi:hypothetical protein
MPDTLGYDHGTWRVRLGTGEWGPVSRAVFDYSVGGRNIIKSWFNYRKAAPGGKKTSPLDEIHVDAWPAEWSVEFIELLSALTRLVEAESAQAELLERILNGQLLTVEGLAAVGVRWPRTTADRKPGYTASAASPDQLTLG